MHASATFVRCAAIGLAALTALAADGPARARAQEPRVRVLLAEGVPSVRIALPGGRLQRVGRGGAAAPWQSPRSGLHRLSAHGTAPAIAVDGRIAVRPDPEGGLAVVASVPLERYVAGAVAREMPAGWHAQALRAQAVVSRTYALHAVRRPAAAAYDLRADQRGQVFGGTRGLPGSVEQAVADTRGKVLVFEGEPILAAFHSASGGRTAGAEEVWGRRLPYLRVHPVGGEEEAPSTYWRASIPRTTMRRALQGLGIEVGPIESMSVRERWPSGRVKRIGVQGAHGRAEFSGRELREALGRDVLKSALFEIRVPQADGSPFVIVGSGHGHGVGMSQWGARAMAARGATYEQILAAFYPGAELVEVGRDARLAAGAPGGGGR